MSGKDPNLEIATLNTMSELDKERLKTISALESRWAVYFHQKETIIWAIVAAYNAAVIAMLGSGWLGEGARVEPGGISVAAALILLGFLAIAVSRVVDQQLRLRQFSALLVAACNCVIADLLSGTSPIDRDYSRNPLPATLTKTDMHATYFIPKCILELKEQWEEAGATLSISHFAGFVKTLVWVPAIIAIARLGFQLIPA